MTEETFSELTFSEQVLAIGKAKQGVRGVSKSQILFMVHGDEILQALDEGLPKKWIWEALRKDKSCPTYPRFIEQLQRFLEKKRPPQPEKPTPERSAAKTPAASAAKAPPTPASAPKTAAPTASASEAVKQVPAKRLESRSFEYEAPTPEAIKELYGEK